MQVEDVPLRGYLPWEDKSFLDGCMGNACPGQSVEE